MPPIFPCPNPACTHTFSPQAIQGASHLVCPRCGTSFQFTSNLAAPPRSSKASKPVAPPPPHPAPLAPAANVPIAQPAAALPSSAALNFNSTPDVVVPRLRRLTGSGGKRRLGSRLTLLAMLLLGLGIAVWGVRWLIHFKKLENAEEDPIRAASLYNCRFALPGKPWKRSKDIELRLRVNLGMISPQDNNSMGLFFRDYQTRLPGDAEMMDQALDKLRSYFQGLAWELKPKAEKMQLGGQPARLLQFQGTDAEQVLMNGECYLLAHRGYAYWFFSWAPLIDRDQLSPEWTVLRQRFSLLDGRKGWVELPPESEKVQGKKAKYQLTFIKGLWTPKPAGDYDERADLVLQGDEPDPERRTHSSKSATFQVLVLAPQESLDKAVAAADDYLRKREMKEYPKTSFEVIKDREGAEIDLNTDIGNAHGHLSKFRVRNAEDLEHFQVAAVINRPEGVLVLVGDCLWARRDFWDQELRPLLDSLKVP